MCRSARPTRSAISPSRGSRITLKTVVGRPTNLKISPSLAALFDQARCIDPRCRDTAADSPHRTSSTRDRWMPSPDSTRDNVSLSAQRQRTATSRSPREPHTSGSVIGCRDRATWSACDRRASNPSRRGATPGRAPNWEAVENQLSTCGSIR